VHEVGDRDGRPLETVDGGRQVRQQSDPLVRNSSFEVEAVLKDCVDESFGPVASDRRSKGPGTMNELDHEVEGFSFELATPPGQSRRLHELDDVVPDRTETPGQQDGGSRVVVSAEMLDKDRERKMILRLERALQDAPVFTRDDLPSALASDLELSPQAEVHPLTLIDVVEHTIRYELIAHRSKRGSILSRLMLDTSP
jgi:hypothetical protein